MQHLKTMSPEIVVNVQDSKLYSLTPLVMAQWYSPWDLKEGSGFKPIGVRVKALPLSFTWGLPTGCQLSLLLSSNFIKKTVLYRLETASRACKLPLDLKLLFNFCCLAHPNLC